MKTPYLALFLTFLSIGSLASKAVHNDYSKYIFTAHRGTIGAGPFNKSWHNIPYAEEVGVNGIQLGEMNKLLLEKIEELTLYVIELKKENTDLEKRLEKLEDK